MRYDIWYHIVTAIDRGGRPAVYVNGERWYFCCGRRIWPIVPWSTLAGMWFWLWRHGMPWRLIPRRYRDMRA